MRVVVYGFIGMCAAALVGASLSALSFTDIEPLWGERDPLAETIATDLRQHPERWTGDGYFIHNDRWVMWIPNGWYSLTVCAVTHSGGEETCYGGDAEFTEKSRKHIWNAAKPTIRQIEARRMDRLRSLTQE